MNISNTSRELNLSSSKRVPYKAKVTYYATKSQKKQFKMNQIINTNSVRVKPRDILILEWK